MGSDPQSISPESPATGAAGELAFNPELHEYRVDGLLLTPVTHLIATVLKTENPWWKLSHRIRGKYVHRIVEAIDRDDWSPTATRFPPSWGEEDCRKVLGRGYAYQRFVAESGYRALHSEMQVFCKAL